MLRLRSATGKGIGIGAQSVNARVSASTGAKTKRRVRGLFLRFLKLVLNNEFLHGNFGTHE